MRSRVHIICIILLVILPVYLSASSKIDTIYFQKGDRITGEVKSMENNQIRLSTDEAGTVKIEWNKVDSVKILSNMRIVLRSGAIFYGKLLPSGESGSCYIWHSFGDPRLTRLWEIVELSRIEDRILSRMDGSLSSGFSYTKASDVMHFNLNGSVSYQAAKNRIQLFYDGIVTRETGKRTQRQKGGTNFLRILPRKWFLIANYTAESSTEQQLDLRSSFGAGGGNSIAYTNIHHFYVAAGLLGNREWSHGTSQNNLEGKVTIDYSVFIYDSPEVSFHVQGDLFPSITSLGRVRTQIDSNLRWEIFSDFFLKWTFFYSYDNRPLSETASKSDWAISLLGIEYHL